VKMRMDILRRHGKRLRVQPEISAYIRQHIDPIIVKC
jgi:hypothetical protein